MKIAAPPVAVLIPGIMLRTGTQSATRLDIEKMGLWVTDLLSDAQLAAAAERYNASIPQNKQFLVAITTLRMTWMNHFNKSASACRRVELWPGGRCRPASRSS